MPETKLIENVLPPKGLIFMNAGLYALRQKPQYNGRELVDHSEFSLFFSLDIESFGRS